MFYGFESQFLEQHWGRLRPPNVVHCSQKQKWVKAMYTNGFEDYFKNVKNRFVQKTLDIYE